MKPSKTPNKIIKSFFVVGINEIKLQKYNLNNNDEQIMRFIQKIDIINTNLNIKIDRYDTPNIKWLRVINNSNFWVRFQYTNNYTNPITDLRIQQCDYYNEEYILLPRNLYENGYRPVKLTVYENISNDIKDIPEVPMEERSFKKLDEKYVLVPAKYNAKYSLNLPAKKKAALLLICRKTVFLPLKEVVLQKKREENSYQFGVQRHKSPYIYKYMPEIIDSYPINEEPNHSVGMFCFPEGIQIKDKFDTPKCFNFVLTDEVGERTYGSALIFVQEISISLRQAFIPSYDDPKKKYYYQKAICILSKYPFYYNCLLFLKEIYNICDPKSISKIPIERAICTFVDSLYIQTYDKLLRFTINDKNIDFYRIANYGKLWDTNDKYLETLFRILSYEQIITAWKGLLLEKKLYLICSSKAVLSHVAYALINLLYPFKWIHVYVPILPEKLKLFIESPVPLIIGISFHIDINELPDDSLILNINKNSFEKYNEKIPPLPPKLNKILMNKLLKLKEQYNLDNPQYVEKLIFNIEEALLYLGPDTSIFPKIDTREIRDAFFNVFINMFKNYGKYFSWIKQSVNLIGTKSNFLKELFLKEHNSTEENSFLSLFCETALFSQFVDSFAIEENHENNVKSSFAFFLNAINKGKGKNKFFLENIIPKNVVFAPKIEIGDLNNKSFNYSEFPELDKSLFIKHEAPKIPYKSRFLYLKDEWCYSTEKFKRKDWIKYYIYIIYDIWFTFFSFILNIYDDNQATIMMDYALSLIEYLSDTLKIIPTRNLFSKIIKSCTRNSLNPFIKQLLIMVKNLNKGQSRFNTLFHNDYLNGLYFLTQNVGQTCLGASLNNSLLLINTLRSSVINEMKKIINNIESKLNTIIFMTYNLCQNCLMTKLTTKAITFDEILAGFIKKKNDDNTSVCSNCFTVFEPKIYYLEENQENLNLKEINLYSPIQLKDKIDEIIKEKGELFFYKQSEWTDVYWNIVFYFQLFDLPTCNLYVENNMTKFEKLNNELKENRKRKLNKEKKVQKKNFFFRLKTNNDSSTNENTLDNSRYASSTSNNTTDYSFSSKNNYIFFSNTEMDIWKNYQLQKQNQKKDITNNITNEDKNEINANIKETKILLNDIIMYFNSNSQEKLKKFLEKYDKLESMRQHDYVNMYLKKENQKYPNNQKEKEIKNKNKNDNKNKNEIKQTQIMKNKEEDEKKQKQVEQLQNENQNNQNQNNQNQNNQQNNVKKDDLFSINTKYNFKINQKPKTAINIDIVDNNLNTEIISDINDQQKIPLDSVINENKINDINDINDNYNQPNTLVVNNKTTYDDNDQLNQDKINILKYNKAMNYFNDNEFTPIQNKNKTIYDSNKNYNRITGIRINHNAINNDNNNYNKINLIHSPQKKTNIIINPNNAKQIVYSSKVNKTFNLYEHNNKLNSQPKKQYNNNTINNNRINNDNNNNQKIYYNKNNNEYNPNKGSISPKNNNNKHNYKNSDNFNFDNKAINYQSKFNNMTNMRYDQPLDNNDEIQIIPKSPNDNFKNKKIKSRQKTEDYQNIQISNQQKQLNQNKTNTNTRPPSSYRIQDYQAELMRQKYQIHQVPAYQSIFDDNYNL